MLLLQLELLSHSFSSFDLLLAANRRYTAIVTSRSFRRPTAKEVILHGRCLLLELSVDRLQRLLIQRDLGDVLVLARQSELPLRS